MSDIDTGRDLILHQGVLRKFSLCIIGDIFRECHADSLKDTALCLNSCQVRVHRCSAIHGSRIVDDLRLTGLKIYLDLRSAHHERRRRKRRRIRHGRF